MKEYIIYRILNLKTRKFYIGRTTTSLKKRWSVHKAYSKYSYDKKSGCPYLSASIKKHGIDNFEIKEIDKASNFKHLIFLEGFYIKYYNSNNPKYGYNLIIDSYGDGLEFISDKTKEKISNSSHIRNGKRNIFYDKSRKKWMISIRKLDFDFKKRFDTLNEAQKISDRLNIYLYNDTNNLFFPELLSEYLSNLDDFIKKLIIKEEKTSRFYGVFRPSINNNTFYAAIHYKPINKKIHIGIFNNEIEAAKEIDKLTFFLYGKSFLYFNFPLLIDENTYLKEGKDIFEKTQSQNRRWGLKRDTSSKYLGVNKHIQSNGWSFEIKINKKRFRGFCKTEEDAAKKRDEIAVKYFGVKAKTNFPIENYISFPS